MDVAHHAVLARATIGNEAKVAAMEEETIYVTAGRPFTVGMAYRVYERSTERDEWRFRFESRLDEGHIQTNRATIQDRPRMRDDQWSNLKHEYLIEKPGEHILRFVAQATLQRADWDGDEDGVVSRGEADGVVRIIAE